MTPPAAAAATGRSPPGVVLLLCIVSFLLLILLASYSPSLEPQGRSHHHRRLKLHPRSSKSASSSSTGAAPGVNGGQHHHHHHHAFDPAIAEVEHRLEDKEWEREHYRLLHGGDGPDEHMKEWEEFLKEEEDLINDDDRFNLNDRIRALFPKIDLAPQDGLVSLDELIKWNLDQARADQLHRSGREMELYDKNGDGIISFEDFKARRQESHRQGNLLGFPWWNEEHFNASDANGDGFLDKAEFNDFLNPSDSENPKIINLLCRQEIT